MRRMWINSGFMRGADGTVDVLWTCSECGLEGLGGVDPPEADCPVCGAKAKQENEARKDNAK